MDIGRLESPMTDHSLRLWRRPHASNTSFVSCPEWPNASEEAKRHGQCYTEVQQELGVVSSATPSILASPHFYYPTISKNRWWWCTSRLLMARLRGSRSRWAAGRLTNDALESGSSRELRWFNGRKNTVALGCHVHRYLQLLDLENIILP